MNTIDSKEIPDTNLLDLLNEWGEYDIGTGLTEANLVTLSRQIVSHPELQPYLIIPQSFKDCRLLSVTARAYCLRSSPRNHTPDEILVDGGFAQEILRTNSDANDITTVLDALYRQRSLTPDAMQSWVKKRNTILRRHDNAMTSTDGKIPNEAPLLTHLCDVEVSQARFPVIDLQFVYILGHSADKLIDYCLQTLTSTSRSGTTYFQQALMAHKLSSLFILRILHTYGLLRKSHQQQFHTWVCSLPTPQSRIYRTLSSCRGIEELQEKIGHPSQTAYDLSLFRGPPRNHRSAERNRAIVRSMDALVAEYLGK